MGAMPRVVLASKSPARLATLRSAGVEPVVRDAGVDESLVTTHDTRSRVLELAQLKGEAALRLLLGDATLAPTRGDSTVLLAADTMLEFDGEAHGKPGSAAEARRRLAQLSGGVGTLFTGHFVAVLRADAAPATDLRAASTIVRFATMDDAEMDAYAASGEPTQVAGSFTIDGLGGPFIAGLDGDPHNVVGLSLPLLRLMLADLGVAWPSLWSRA